MKPYYDADGITIYHGDALAVLATLEDNAGDLVVTDVPFDEMRHVNNRVDRIGRGHDVLRDLAVGDADDATFDLLVAAAAFQRVARGSIYVFCGFEQISPLRRFYREAGLTTRLGFWQKTDPSPMNGERLWLSALEACVFARKDNATFTRRCEAPVWKGPIDRLSPHPTPKPVWLMERLIAASSKPDDLVIDPCMGCGPTLRAAANLGRRAIGVDLNEEYCEVAARRAQSAVERAQTLGAPTMPLFGGPDASR